MLLLNRIKHPLLSCIVGTVLAISLSQQSIAQSATAVAPEAPKPELVLQFGHLKEIGGVAYSPDGHTMASAGQDRTLRLWSENGDLKRIIKSTTPLTAVAFSADGKTVCAGDSSSQIQLWESRTGKSLWQSPPKPALKNAGEDEINKKPSGIRFIAFGKSTKSLWQTIITAESNYGDRSAAIQVWELLQPNVETVFPIMKGGAPRLLRTIPLKTSNLRSTAISPDGQIIACGQNEKAVTLWDLQTGERVKTITDFKAPVEAVAFSPDGQTLATGSDVRVGLWDVNSGRNTRNWTAHLSNINNLAFSPDGKTLAVSDGVELKLWNVESGGSLRSWKHGAESIRSLVFSPDGQTLLGGLKRDVLAPRANIMQWEVSTGKPLYVRPKGPEPVNWLQVSSKNSWLLSFADDLRYWTIKADQPLTVKRNFVYGMDAIAVASSGRTYATCYYEQILINDFGQERSKRVINFEGVINRQTLAFSPDDKTLAAGIAGLDQGLLRLWNVATGKAIKSFSLGKGTTDVTDVEFSPDGRLVACSYGTDSQMEDNWVGRIKVFRLSDGKLISTFSGHTESVWNIAFSADSRSIASASDDKTVRIWKIPAGTPSTQAKPLVLRHQGQVQAVAVSSNGKLLASGDESTLKIWNASNGELLKTLTGHDAFINAVAFSADGLTVATGSDDGTTKLWSVTNGQLLLTLLTFPNSDNLATEENWLAYTPDGYFDGSSAAATAFRWRLGDEIFPAGEFEEQYRNPAIIEKRLFSAN